MAVVIVTVRNRIAAIPEGVELICNNPSDTIRFDLDSEWDAHVLKTARFSWQRKFVDVPFSGNEVNVPDIDRTNYVDVGVYADGLTSTAVRIPYLYSIKSAGGSESKPAADVYDAIVKLVNDGAVRGPEGYTPQRGTDYWTEDDIDDIQEYVENAILKGKW